ncbi:MAG: hypothetical protein L3J91_07260, partial [Thermoplasmata archaeon]|nr:hypothetical protein [Thermoplasmata archaeon]
SPDELGIRLARARRGSRRQRDANVVAEATDHILFEALALHRRIWEVDTTARTIASVATEVERLYRRRPSPRYGKIDWLAKPSVTEHLLRPAR